MLLFSFNRTWFMQAIGRLNDINMPEFNIPMFNNIPVFNMPLFPNLVKLVIRIYSIHGWNHLPVLLNNMPNLVHITFADVSLRIFRSSFIQLIMIRRKIVIYWLSRSNVSLYILLGFWGCLDLHCEIFFFFGVHLFIIRGFYLYRIQTFLIAAVGIHQRRHRLVYFSWWRKLLYVIGKL